MKIVNIVLLTIISVCFTASATEHARKIDIDSHVITKHKATINNQKNIITNQDSSKLSEGGIATLPSNLESYFEIKNNKKKYIGEKRVLGSCAFEMMLIAKGISTYGILGPASSWDFAAGIIIIQESGGKILKISQNKKWETFNSFENDYKIDVATIEKIRNWKGILVAGQESIINFTTNNLTPKKSWSD